MRLRDERQTPQAELLRSELVNLINPDHALMKLVKRINWSFFECG